MCANLVGESRTSVRVVEAFCYDRKKDKNNAEENGKPEVGRFHDVHRNAFERPMKGTSVQDQSDGKVDNYAAPNRYVIDANPVICFQAALKQ